MKGLQQKYYVERLDGKPLTACFVMEVKDKAARESLLVYAEKVQAEHPQLAHDLRTMIKEYEDKIEYYKSKNKKEVAT